MQTLKKVLDQKIVQFKEQIAKDLVLFKKSNAAYKNKVYDDEFIVIFKKISGNSYMSIGFPFPILTYHFEKFKEKNVSIMGFLTGEPVIQFQRNQLVQDLEGSGKKIIFREVKSMNQFKKITSEVMKSRPSFNYYDPYSFIGDSFIGLYLAHTFEKAFNSQIDTVYSENYQQLECCIKSKGFLEKDFYKEKKVHLFADLIANQWARTKYLVRRVTSENNPSIIIGRDIIVSPHKEYIEIFHYDRKGVLLKSENIEHYMDKCLSPFLEITEKSKKTLLEIKNENLIINPFGSCDNKTIPVELVQNIIDRHKKENPHAKILVISGFKNNYSHLLWAARLRASLVRKYFEKDVILKNYGSFNEIKKDLSRYCIDIGITADTSIAHFFNYLNMLTITLYNLERIDLMSPQSLASDGPLGFCRYSQNQIPVLFSGKGEKNIEEGIIGCINYFNGKNKNKSWINKVFNDKVLISKISVNNKDLIEANKMIGPLNKL